MAGVSTKPLTLSATLPSTIPMSTAAAIHARNPGTLQAQREPPGGPDASLSRSWPVGQQACAEVAAPTEHEGGSHEHHGGHQRQDEHPPARAGEGPHLLAPADRRQPREPPRTALGKVADRPGDVGDSLRTISPRPVAAPRAHAELCCDPTHGREQQPGRAPRSTERDGCPPGAALPIATPGCRQDRDRHCQ